MRISLTKAGTAYSGSFPGFFKNQYTRPKGKGTALKGPGIVNFTAGIPKNTVKIGFFL
jgi:hypothetical protein